MAGQARRRLDAELVRRGLARSREQAVELITAGRVTVGGQAAGKAATQVETSAAIVVTGASDGGESDYASRGGHKLAGALTAFGPAGLIVGDLSFISLTLMLPALARCAAPDADLALMVKPQFEVGRDRLGSGGVVRDSALHADAVRTVAGAAWSLGLGVLGITASPLPGPSGNVEYFLWLRAGAAPLEEAQLARAIAEGPTGVGAGVSPRTSVRSDGHRN